MRTFFALSLSVLIVIIFPFVSVLSANQMPEWEVSFTEILDVDETLDDWLNIGEYFTMVSPDGEVLAETGRRIYVEDQFLSSGNNLYEVIKVENNIAYTKWIEKVELPSERISLTAIREQLGLSITQAQEHNGSPGTIAVYHTHNAESYIPTDGTHSIDGKGGIHAVGQAFADELSRLGVNTDYSEALHLPHDRGAYRRSRSTVLDLLSREPDAIFDIHRDAAPINAYAAQIGDEWLTQVQFVVGRQNQNLGINRQYAQSLKNIADQVYPGLVKGIFFASGNYNQDLTPLNLLLEVGAHTNSRDAAKRGISLFAEVVDFYFYGPRDERETEAGLPPGASSTANRTIIGIILLVIISGIVFFVINAGGFQAAWLRIKSFKIKRK